jgi:hypothetical protein
VIHAIPSTWFEVTFEVLAAAEFMVSGGLSAQGAPPVVLSSSRVKLSGAGGAEIFLQAVEPGPGGALNEQDVNVSGDLAPGTYTLLADAAAVIDSTVPPNGAGVAQFAIVFHAIVPGDVTGDNAVDVNDLLAVIEAWGACPAKGECPADIAPPFAGDQAVNVNDLLRVIENWD